MIQGANSAVKMVTIVFCFDTFLPQLTFVQKTFFTFLTIFILFVASLLTWSYSSIVLLRKKSTFVAFFSVFKCITKKMCDEPAAFTTCERCRRYLGCSGSELGVPLCFLGCSLCRLGVAVLIFLEGSRHWARTGLGKVHIAYTY